MTCFQSRREKLAWWCCFCLCPVFWDIPGSCRYWRFIQRWWRRHCHQQQRIPQVPSYTHNPIATSVTVPPSSSGPLQALMQSQQHTWDRPGDHNSLWDYCFFTDDLNPSWSNFSTSSKVTILFSCHQFQRTFVLISFDSQAITSSLPSPRLQPVVYEKEWFHHSPTVKHPCSQSPPTFQQLFLIWIQFVQHGQLFLIW